MQKEMAVEPEVDLASGPSVARFRAGGSNWRCQRSVAGHGLRARFELRTAGLRKRACDAVRGRGLGCSERCGRGGQRSLLDERFFHRNSSSSTDCVAGSASSRPTGGCRARNVNVKPCKAKAPNKAYEKRGTAQFEPGSSYGQPPSRLAR